MKCLLAFAMAAGTIAGSVMGQEKVIANASAELASYDVNREVTRIGTVQAYAATVQTAPFGAHVMLETSSGLVDVHVGDARFLEANHFTVQSGDTLRIIGELVAYGKGTQFIARIVQKGTQVLAVRSVRGIPLSYRAPRDGVPGKPQGGVL
jgi:hypothetical protein